MIIDKSGVTEISLGVFYANKDKLGTIEEVECMGSSHNLIIYGSNDNMELSGCRCGYKGEGPRGTATILNELGLNPDDAIVTAHLSRFHIRLIASARSKELTPFQKCMKYQLVGKQFRDRQSAQLALSQAAKYCGMGQRGIYR